MAEKRLKIFYDRKGYVLYISIGSPQVAIFRETGDHILIRMDVVRQGIVGFTIFNFTERFSYIQEERAVPVTSKFQMTEEESFSLEAQS